MRTFYKTNVRAVRTLTKPGEDAIARLHENFSTLSNRLFYHDDKATLSLRAWEETDSTNYSKLTDRDDETVDHTGSKVPSIKPELYASSPEQQQEVSVEEGETQ